MDGNVINFMIFGGNIVSDKDEYENEKKRNRTRNEML